MKEANFVSMLEIIKFEKRLVNFFKILTSAITKTIFTLININ